MAGVTALGGAAAALAPKAAEGDDVPVTIDRDSGREAAERELSKPVYQADEPGLVERAVEWVLDRLNDLLGAALDLSPGGWAGLAVIALAVLALLIALRLRLGRLRPGPHAATASLFDASPRSSDEHRAAAEREAAAGAWSAAVQERMRAVVRGLEERALLDPQPGRTADEAATEAGRALPGHAAALRSAARAFDEVTYAGRPGTQAAHAELRALDEALRRARPQLTSTGPEEGPPR
ncbi:DUF4129 domain-containing protein [Streptomyces sp. JJ38]|uniref:DUF4129 domain-containing protein n=1 Tax=Streptomyces sp. JJ38 TaxID=2738128 RepID=UPI001C585D2A|nr:DUF4129 domain-containing protein [Streptomyces sp. JJ38]MBW1599922.1 DUF4129 domain-containing protein [Streptomyces sp. JJ38]